MEAIGLLWNPTTMGDRFVWNTGTLPIFYHDKNIYGQRTGLIIMLNLYAFSAHILIPISQSL